MKLHFNGERVLAVTAHPDDAELLCTGTLARARHDSAEIAICVMCQGDKGQPPSKIEDLGKVRRVEAEAAASRLGARLFWAGYSDGSLSDGYEQRMKIVEVVRTFRATLVLAHAPEDYHPDHRASSAIAEAASWLCSSAGQVTNSPPLDRPPAVWWMDTIQMQSFEPGFFVDINEYVELKEQMLACHKSQLQRASQPGFPPLLAMMRRQYQMRGAQASVSAAEAFRIDNVLQRARAW